jgi:hypothetical protein
LEEENISYNQLIEFVKSMGQRAKKPFREALKEVSIGYSWQRARLL